MPNKENIEKHQFKPGNSGNVRGRPKKHFKQHIQDIKNKGYQVPSREEYAELCALLLSMDEEDINEFLNDRERPYWIRCLVNDINDPKIRSRIYADFRNSIYGSPTQSINSDENHQIEIIRRTIGNGDKE